MAAAGNELELMRRLSGPLADIRDFDRRRWRSRPVWLPSSIVSPEKKATSLWRRCATPWRWWVTPARVQAPVRADPQHVLDAEEVEAALHRVFLQRGYNSAAKNELLTHVRMPASGSRPPGDGW